MKFANFFSIFFVIYFFCTQTMQRPSKMITKNNNNLAVYNDEQDTMFKQNFRKARSAIPLFSLEEINYVFHHLPAEKKSYVNWKMSNSLIFSFAISLREIRNNILVKILDDNDDAVELFNKIPLLFAFDCYGKIKSYAPLHVGNKIYSIGSLLRLSVENLDKLDLLIQIAHRPILERLIGKSRNIVEFDEYATISQLPVNINKGLKLKVIDERYMPACQCYSSLYCSACLSLVCFSKLFAVLTFGGCIGAGCCCAHHYKIRHSTEVEL